MIVTGASSGLGAGLACGLATPGRYLTLVARRGGELAQVASQCVTLGADVEIHAADVRDRQTMANIIESAHQRRPLDLVIANAGIGGGDGITSDDIYAVNIDGMRNTIEPALDFMLPQGRGQLAVMSSLAGFRGLPSAPAYSVSKCFVRAYGEALQGRCRRAGISVSVICPGFVDTPMTRDNPFRMPFLMDEQRARAIILKGLARHRSRIAFPWQLYWFCALLPLLPASLVERIFAKQQSKET